MGARQVPRHAVVASLLALAQPAWASGGDAAAPGPAPRGSSSPTPGPITAAPAATDPSEAVIVVDLRTGDAAVRARSRAALADGLDQVTGVRVRRDDGLLLALAGEGGDRDTVQAQTAVDEARDAFGALDCARARPAADHAVELLAARQAAGLADGALLRAAWAYALLCADHDGDPHAAHVAATALRNLGVQRGDDVGISAATWDRFPEIDAATDRDIAEVTVAAPAGAAIWIDHLAVGTAPLTTFVAGGAHLIAAAAPASAPRALRGATRVRVGGKPLTVEVPVADATSPWVAAGTRVVRWRAMHAAPPAELGALLRRLHARFAVVLVDGRPAVSAELWALGPSDAQPRRIDTGSHDALRVGGEIADRVATWQGRTGLVLETPRRRGEAHARWWVYASIVGAVFAGGAIIYAQDSAQDRQRVELSWP